MPKAKTPPDQKAQSERFKSEAERMIAAGELNPIEAGERLERAVSSLTGPKPRT